jgi:hypothetical protein
MGRRGYRHKSPLDAELADGEDRQTDLVDSIQEQVLALREKGCGCDV